MKNIKFYRVTIFFLILVSFCAFTIKSLNAQSFFKGRVLIAETSLPNVSVCLIKNNKIVAYTISTQSGNYEIKIPENYKLDNTCQLQFTCIGFQKRLISIEIGITIYNVQLVRSNIKLPNVEVKTTPKLIAKNDTLTYDVASFAKKQDRKIGDVIKKMPGIEMSENGKIFYNGKAISNFYIDGDDLLGDRYNIASNALPVDMVDKIQILENHQAIKALKEIKSSEDVALNLKLKNTAKLKVHGVAELGAGFSQKYDASISSLGFFKKQKFLNVIKGNNIGGDLKAEIAQLNYRDYLNRIEKEGTDRVLIPEIMYLTPINRNRYFNNNSLLSTLNNIVNIKKDVSLRTNLIFLPENIKFSQLNVTTVFLQNDTIGYLENQYSKSKRQQFTGEVQLNVNKQTFFLNNKFSFQKDNSYIATNIERTSDSIIQDYRDRKITYSNDFSILKVLKGKHIVEFFSYISNTTLSEKALWQQGLYPDILNDSTMYLRTIQSVQLPTFFMNNYFSYGRRFGKYFIQSYKAGFSYQHQKLESEVNLLQLDNRLNNAVDSFRNNFIWHKSKAYFILSNDWKIERLKISLKVPVNYFYFKLEKSKVEKFILNPQLAVKYNVGAENSLSLNASTNNNFGNIQSIYQGYILKNYRSISANTGLLAEQKQKNVSVGFNYRKSAKILFANFLFGYSQIKSNTIVANTINGIFDRKILLPVNNSQNNWFVNMGISKYLFKYGTTVSIKSGFQRGIVVQLINDELQSFYSNSINIVLEISYKKSNWVNFSYKPDITESVSNPSGKKMGQIINQKQKLFLFHQSIEFVVYPGENLQVKLTTDQFYSNNRISRIKSNIYFADFSLRYKLKKLRTDVEVLCNNIFNKREFSNPVLFSNTTIDTKIALNPRMLIAKFVFTF